MFNNKRGQSMSMNTVIIGILVLIVLIVIIAFFTGGAGTVIDKVKGIFGMSTKGQDIGLALKSCDNYCEQAKSIIEQEGTNSQQYISQSAYCTSWFKLDKDNDGKVDVNMQGKTIHYYCGSKSSTADEESAKGNLGKECGEVTAC